MINMVTHAKIDNKPLCNTNVNGRSMKKEKFFTIGEAAAAARTTSETLRHYDRIGLVRPSRKDPWTGYRYYTGQDIVRLNTVRALQLMDLSLKEIKEVLEYNDLEKIVDFLKQAEKKADEKIAALQYSKAKIKAAKADYERKLKGIEGMEGLAIKELPERVIMLSDTLEEPTVANLWNYLSHFYHMIPEDLKDRFQFEDLAGIYAEKGTSRLFAVCTRYEEINGLVILPAGRYLCAGCTEEDRKETVRRLKDAAWDRYGLQPGFTVQLIVVSGILQWNYEVQVPI